MATDVKDKLVTLENLKAVVAGDTSSGINLLRGTRDFDLGREYETFGTDSGYFSDGFRNQGAFTFYTDEDGFTVAHREQSGLSADLYKYIYGSIVHLEPGEVATYSFEFMVDDASAWDRKYVGHIQCFEAGTSVSTFKIDLYPGIVGVSTVESGKWYKARYTLDQKIDKAADVRFGLYLIRNGSINFKRACVYKGDITNPVWSPSPFDTTRNVLKRNSPIYNLGYVESNYIQANEDLNDYIFAGTYACASGVTAQSLDNCPSTSAFKLYVEYSSGGQTKYIQQKLKTYNSYAITFFRYSDDNGSTWTNWRQTYENYEIRPIAGGGTNANTARAAQYNLLSDMAVSTGAVDDTSQIVQVYPEGQANISNGKITAKPLSYFWNWIASKIRSVFGFTEDNKLPADRIDGNTDESYVDINISSSGISSQDLNFNGINLVIKKGNSEWEELVKKDRIDLTLEFSSGSILSTSTDIHYRCSIHLEYSLGDDTISLYPEVTSGTATQGWTVFPVPTNSCTMTMGPLTKDQFNAGYTFPLRFSKYMPYKQSSSSSAGIATISLGDSVRIYRTK